MKLPSRALWQIDDEWMDRLVCTFLWTGDVMMFSSMVMPISVCLQEDKSRDQDELTFERYTRSQAHPTLSHIGRACCLYITNCTQIFIFDPPINGSQKLWDEEG